MTQRRAQVDFAFIRRHVTIRQVLAHLGWARQLKGPGAQRRGPCPIHQRRDESGREFSVNLQRNLFQCFAPTCRAKGNVLDLWAAVHRVSLAEAAEQMFKIFHLTSQMPLAGPVNHFRGNPGDPNPCPNDPL